MKKHLFRILIMGLVLFVTLGVIGFILQAQKANIDDVPGHFEAVMRMYYVGQHMATVAVFCGVVGLLNGLLLLLMQLIHRIKKMIERNTDF